MEQITNNELRVIAENKDLEEKIKYQKPEILMIDCDKKVNDELKEKGFNIEVGSFGRIYNIVDNIRHQNCILNHKINNVIEKDVVVINMKQSKEADYVQLEEITNLSEGSYLTTIRNQKEFNPINFVSGSCFGEDFQKLITKDSIFIVFADREVNEKYTYTKVENGYLEDGEMKISNYSFLPFDVSVDRKEIESTKFRIIENEVSKGIFKGYKGKICSKCTFYHSPYEKNILRIIENSYGDLIGYLKVLKNKNGTKSMLIILPQCENMTLIMENILTQVLPEYYPEIFKEFVIDKWQDKEEYMLPELKEIMQEKQNICNEYEAKVKEIEEKIKIIKEKNEFLYNIINSTGTGDKLVESIIKCLEFLEYSKVENYDKVRKDGEREEDIHIYKNEEEYFIAEVKGINGPAIEDDCNVIVKYKLRNCDRLGVPRIHGVVFVNYHKNVEPNVREELGFTAKEIKDAKINKYTLVGTYELFKAIRLCQENILDKERVKNALETPGIFRAIPEYYEKLGKIENILNKIDVICIPLECEEINVDDELLIVEKNNYYKTKIVSIQVEGKNVNKAKKGEKVGIKIDKIVPKTISSQVYLIK